MPATLLGASPTPLTLPEAPESNHLLSSFPDEKAGQETQKVKWQIWNHRARILRGWNSHQVCAVFFFLIPKPCPLRPSLYLCPTLGILQALLLENCSRVCQNYGAWGYINQTRRGENKNRLRWGDGSRSISRVTVQWLDPGFIWGGA